MAFNTAYKPLNDLLNWAQTNIPESISEVNKARLDGLVNRIKSGESIDKVLQDVRKYIIGSKAISGWVEGQGYGTDMVPQITNDLITGKARFTDVGSGEYGFGKGDTSQAIPKDARIVKVGKQYRMVWNLGDGLGWAWYDAKAEDLKRIFGTATPDPHLEMNNPSQFKSRFGDNYWGHISETNLRADTPWDDLKGKIFNTFGWVPGLDDPEVRRTILQGYFENWSEAQFTVEYRKTDYFQGLTKTQREWVGLSQAERNQRIQDISIQMANAYRNIWGDDISLSDPEIKAAATKIASGAELLDKWLYTQRQEARATDGTPEARRAADEERAAREPENRAENMGLYAEQQFREWIGPGPLPQNFGKKWGKWLAEGHKSEADLENYLKNISISRWQNKPHDVTWADWAAPFKSQIRQTLELPSLDDADPLLSQILKTEGLEGADINRTIRRDERFRGTQTLYNELSSATSELGRQFGFIG